MFIKFQHNTKEIFGIDDMALATIGGSILSSTSADSTNKKQIEANERQMKNKYQWEADDLQKAGLNRILGYSKGAAPIPGVGTLKQPFSSASARDMAMAAKEVLAGIDKTKAETNNINQQTNLVNSQKILTDLQQLTERNKTRTEYFKGNTENARTGLVQNQAVETWARGLLALAETSQANANTEQIKQTTKKAYTETQILLEKLKGWKIEGKIDQTTYGEYIRYIERSLKTVQTAGGLVGLGSLLKNLSGLLPKGKSLTDKFIKEGLSK